MGGVALPLLIASELDRALLWEVLAWVDEVRAEGVME